MERIEATENWTADGKRILFEQLMRRTRPRANAQALMLTRNTADAEDLLQVSILRAWSRFESFDQERSFGKWLSVIMMHAFLDRRRAEGRRVKTVSYENTPNSVDGDSYLMEFPETGPLLEERVITRDQYDLEEALQKIPETHRRIVLMCDMLGYDYQDCAASEGVPVGTVRSRLFRGRRKLRTILEKGFDSGLLAA